MLDMPLSRLWPTEMQAPTPICGALRVVFTAYRMLGLARVGEQKTSRRRGAYI